MKTSKYYIALSLLAAVVSCNKTVQEPQEASDDLVTITAILPDDDPAVKAAGLKSVLSWTWNEGDKITVVGETTEIFKIKSGFTPKKAQFVGKAVKGTSFTILYPGAEAVETDWNTQVQNGNNNLNHLQYQASLNGVDSYTQFAFNAGWAEEHGGALKQTGVFKFTLGLPVEVTKPESVSLSADEAIFYSGNAEEATSNSLVLGLNECTVDDGTLVAWFTTSWNEAQVASGTTLYVTVSEGEKSFSRDVIISADKVVKTGCVNTFTLSGEGWSDEAVNAHYAGGKGTKAAPWIITSAEQMAYMATDMVSNSIRYYKLGADIDLDGVAWAPLNNVEPFDKFIDFDGDGHTISNLSVAAAPYASFFGVLYGNAKNVTFANATVTAEGNVGAVVAAYVGTKDDLMASCTVTDVKVKDSKVTGSVNNIGGFVAVSEGPGAKFENCSIEGSEVAPTAGVRYVAGFVANVNNVAIFENCTVKDVKVDASASNRVGGFVGQANRSEGTSITHCVVENVTLNGGQNSGGFVGVDYAPSISQCAVIGGTINGSNVNIAGFAAYPEGNASVKCQILDCYSTMEVNGGDKASIGGFLGAAKGNIIVKNCYAAGVVTGTHAKTGIFAGSVDVNTAAISSCIGWHATMPFAGTVADGAAEVKDNYAGADGTISAKAVEQGWSADIWDFSGDAPKIK